VISRIPWTRLIRFGLVGMLNTAFGYSLFAVGIWIGLGSALALLITTCCGVIFNFFTTGRLVFANRDSALIFRFIGAYAIIYAINLALLKAIEAMGLSAFAAQAICLVPVVILSFLILQTFVFKQQAPTS